MSAAAALARLHGLGVTAEARGAGLVLRPASVVPADLLAELKARKAEVVALLTETALPPPSPEAAVDEAEDRASIASVVWQGDRPAPTDLPADLVERLAQAMVAPRPWQRVTDPVRALAYFNAQARRRLAPLDALSRGLLVQAEETTARRWGSIVPTMGNDAQPGNKNE